MKRSWFVWLLGSSFLVFSVAFSQVARQRPAQLARPSAKIEQFLKFLETAKSLNEVKAELAQVRFTAAEIDELKNNAQQSARYKQNMDRIVAQSKAILQPKMNMAEARMATMAKEANAGRLAAAGPGRDRFGPKEPATCPPSGPLKIAAMPAELNPGYDFTITGTGFGDKQGTIRVVLPETLKSLEQATISSWKDCYIRARLSADIPELDKPQTQLVLMTSRAGLGDKVSRAVTVRPRPQYITLSDNGFCIGVGGLFPLGSTGPEITACDKVCFDFPLINGYYVYKLDFEPMLMSEDADSVVALESSPPLNTPNVSLRTLVKARMSSCNIGGWGLSIVLAGPKGKPYRN